MLFLCFFKSILDLKFIFLDQYYTHVRDETVTSYDLTSNVPTYMRLRGLLTPQIFIERNRKSVRT